MALIRIIKIIDPIFIPKMISFNTSINKIGISKMSSFHITNRIFDRGEDMIKKRLFLLRFK